MRTNARALFVVSLLALLCMLGWRGYVEYQALRGDDSSTETQPDRPPRLPSLPPYEGLGILEYVNSQTQTNFLALPVDLFRPSLDSFVSNLVDAILNDPDLADSGEGIAGSAAAAEEAAGEVAAGGGEAGDKDNLFDVDPAAGGKGGKTAGGAGEKGRPGRVAPPPRLLFEGVFKRTDGQIAAWITDINNNVKRFYKEGDELFGVELAAVGVNVIELRLADGKMETLTRGDTVELPAPEGEAPPPAPPAQAAGVGADKGEEKRPAGGLFQRGRPRRMPTAEELAAIEKENPEQAKRIREAIRRRMEQNRAQGAKP